MAVTQQGPAFVAGATGYTGSALVAELRRRGIDVVAHVRPDSPGLAQWRERFSALGAQPDATPWEESAMAATLERVRPAAVFALLGTTRRRARAGDGSYESVDYGLGALLLRACMRAAPAARFVYLSSLGVGPRARGEYLRVRWRLEQEIERSGMDYTIVRPGFITGPDRSEARPLERIGAAAANGVLRLAGLLGARTVRDRYSSITGAQLARALADHAYDAASARRILSTEELR